MTSSARPGKLVAAPVSRALAGSWKVPCLGITPFGRRLRRRQVMEGMQCVQSGGALTCKWRDLVNSVYATVSVGLGLRLKQSAPLHATVTKDPDCSSSTKASQPAVQSDRVEAYVELC